jgi:hypothetical protein
MIINLKQIRTLDTENIKLDKINYNFDQLVANGGGPKGPKGSVGPLGPQGFQGARGTQGDRGIQGVQGPSAITGDSYWTTVPQNLSNTTNVVATIFAKNPNTAPITSLPAVVGSGFINADSKYNQQQQNNGVPKYQWIVNRRSDKVTSNLRFTSADIQGNAFDITMDNSPSAYNLLLGFINNTNSQLNFQAAKHIIKSTNTGNNLLEVSNDAVSAGGIYTDTIFEKPVTFNQKLNYDILAKGVNKVVTAENNTGHVTFKTTMELGGSVKIGTIISILPSIFSDSSRFINFEVINTASSPNEPIQIRMGSGIGDYSGWYVCNGQRWTDGAITDPADPDFYKWQVPDLNSFSYQIVSNPTTTDPNSQGYVNVNNDEIQLIGGADILIDAIESGVSSAQYDIGLTDNSNDPQIDTNNTGSGFSIKIKKLPQIIYLGTNNLYWYQLGTGQAITTDYSQSDYSSLDYNAG